MPRRLSLSMALLAGLAGIGQVAAQELPPTPAGSLASQRQWLLQQVRIGEATGRQRLIEDALARLRLLAPDDRATMVAILEVQLSQQKIDDATGTLQRLRQIGAGSRELIAGERLWAAYRGDMQAELQQARMLATGGRNAEALAIYRRLFDDDPPGMQLGLEYWRLRGAEPAGRALAIRRLTALDEAYTGNTVLLQTLAQFLFASGRDGEALAILGRMGSNPEASTYAADAEWDYLSSRQADATNVRRLQSFIARYPGWVHLDDARRLYDEQRRRVGNPAWLAGLRGGQLLDAGRNAEAETAFRQALRGFPQEADFQGGLGLALMRQGRREQALEQFQTAQRLQADTSNSDKWRDLIASTRYWLLIDQADAALEAGELDRARKRAGSSRARSTRSSGWSTWRWRAATMPRPAANCRPRGASRRTIRTWCAGWRSSTGAPIRHSWKATSPACRRRSAGSMQRSCAGCAWRSCANSVSARSRRATWPPPSSWGANCAASSRTTRGWPIRRPMRCAPAVRPRRPTR